MQHSNSERPSDVLVGLVLVVITALVVSEGQLPRPRQR